MPQAFGFSGCTIKPARKPGGVPDKSFISNLRLAISIDGIEDEHDTSHPDYIQTLSPQRHLVRGATPIEQFNQFFDTQIDMTEFDTISGIITQQFGHIPTTGEITKIGSLVFTVKQATATTIQMLEVHNNR